MRPWILDEVNYGYIKEHPCEVAVLPMGATEPHNLHLPYGTDTFQVEQMCGRACEIAHGQGAPVLMLPAIPYGTETNLQGFPLAMNLHPSTLLAIFRDLIDTLALHKIRKLVIVNGHGGNEFKPMLRELFGRGGVHLFLCEWYRGLSADVQKEIFDTPDDHAGEVETSLGLALFPQLVARDEKTGALRADAGATRVTQFDAVNRGWISITRPWHLLTTNTGSGNPHKGSAEKGQKLFEHITTRLGGFLTELAAARLDDQFPYPPT